MRHTFRIRLSYFDAHGTIVGSQSADWPFRSKRLDAPMSGVRMAEVVEKVRELRDKGGPGALPGVTRDGWDGPILIECKGAVNEIGIALPARDTVPQSFILQPRRNRSK